jgi:pyridoxamine 5'-phosphate oxidase
MVQPEMADEASVGLPPWRPLLRAARQREGRAPGGGWLQLATVSAEGWPRVRTLVFRGWSAQGELELLTDTRSEKSNELLDQPQDELCWLFRRTREQFRLRGLARLMDGQQDRQALEQHWQRLTPRGRAVWGWPQPGATFDPAGPWAEQIPDDVPQPEALALIRVQLERVEQLDLKPHPHRRRCWLRDQGWLEQQLNP